MPKIFLISPAGQDTGLTCYRFECAKQHLYSLYPNAVVFNACEDLDWASLPEQALASGFDSDNLEDRWRLLFRELLQCSRLYLLPGWEEDELCRRCVGLAKEAGIRLMTPDLVSGGGEIGKLLPAGRTSVSPTKKDVW